ncbi:MAG: TlpA disulfide reductase family protein, partial [Bacteroidota bacterium]
KDFAVKCKEFFDRFPRSDKRPEVFSAFASAFFQINNATILLNELEKIDDVPDAIYARIAYEIATDKDLLQDLRPSERIDTALSIFSEIWGGKLPPDSLLMADKPQYYTSHEWRKNKMAVYGSIAETGGDLYLIDGDNLKAMNMYESALRLQQYNTPESLYEKLLTTADELDRDSLALDYSARAITNSKMTDNIVKAFELHFKKLNAVDDSLYNQALDSLLAKAQDRRLTELKYKMLDYKPEAGVLKTLDGRIIDLIDLRGKITIMNFWASWCGPCQAMMPAVDSLYSEYDEDPDVEVVAVNIWEQSADREQAIKNFLKDVESRFPVAYDDLDVLPRRFGITGLPVTVFLDEEGYLRFKYEGYSNIDDFMIACFDRVNLLKKMVQKNEAGR